MLLARVRKSSHTGDEIIEDRDEIISSLSMIPVYPYIHKNGLVTQYYSEGNYNSLSLKILYSYNIFF